MTNRPLDLLKGMPVFVMRAGHFPNKSDVLAVMADHPNSVVRTEVIHHPHTRFVLTVRENNHVR